MQPHTQMQTELFEYYTLTNIHPDTDTKKDFGYGQALHKATKLTVSNVSPYVLRWRSEYFSPALVWGTHGS